MSQLHFAIATLPPFHNSHDPCRRRTNARQLPAHPVRFISVVVLLMFVSLRDTHDAIFWLTAQARQGAPAGKACMARLAAPPSAGEAAGRNHASPPRGPLPILPPSCRTRAHPRRGSGRRNRKSRRRRRGRFGEARCWHLPPLAAGRVGLGPELDVIQDRFRIRWQATPV